MQSATVDPVAAQRVAFWRGMSQRYEPRNVAKLKHEIEHGYCGQFVVSFVGPTKLLPFYPQVYCDSGRAYDWRFLARGDVVPGGAWIVTQPGIDVGPVLRDVFDMVHGYVGLIDTQNQVVADVAMGARGLKLYPYVRGCEPWQAVFG